MSTAEQNAGKKDEKNIVTSFYKTFRSFTKELPILFGVILLLGLFKTFVTAQMITSVFTGNLSGDTVIGALIGSISAGNAIMSYIIGGELLKDGVSLFAVTAFIIAWVTVGLVQLPAEVAILGKRFAIFRNILSFIFAIFVSIATVMTLMVIR